MLLADDHVLVRQGIRQFLEEPGDIEVIAEADNGAEALRLVNFRYVVNLAKELGACT